ncbi:MAG: hypothetical protein QM770_01645 [Tepidisphaeraceae bacterium]
MKALHFTLLALLLLSAFTPRLHGANNVDLSTVPHRDTVQLTIYNSEDLTLVRETRKITFKKGVNPLQFSWANTLIDPTSVELKFLTHAALLEVLDTTYPQAKPQMLYWNVQSEIDGEATIEITYFTSGISWSADYVCKAEKDEGRATLEGFVRVTNNSGEAYDNAQVRLVVGNINLVEKIAQLAQIPMEEVARLERQDRDQYRKRALDDALAKAQNGAAFGGGIPEPTTSPQQAKQVIKEGLSEYFIYTIEGTEMIPNGWSKRLRSIEAKDVPLKIQYRYRPQEYGEQLVRMYLLTNDKPSNLGTTPLPNGTVRVFRDNGRDGLSFLAAQDVKYIPIGDKIELNLGVDPEVIFELVRSRVWRSELWLQVNGTSTFKRVGDAAAKIEENSQIVGWDEHALFTQRIRNYTAKPIEVEVRRSFDGDVEFRSDLKAAPFDYCTAQYTTTLEPGKRADLLYEVTTHLGHNAKQNHVTLVDADVKR